MKNIRLFILGGELIDRIGFTGSRETLRKIMIKLGFEWKKTQTNRSLLMERTDVVVDRINYLRQVRKYRQEGRPVFYTDETTHSAKRSWQSKEYSIKVPFGKGTRYIVVHAGSENGFLDGAELVFKAKSTTGD